MDTEERVRRNSVARVRVVVWGFSTYGMETKQRPAGGLNVPLH